jgi:hypothetical protein
MTDLRPESQKKIDEAYLDYPNPGDFPEFDAGKYGITEFKQAIANAEVGAVLGSGAAAEFGTKIDAATMPTGGTGNLGWLSAIWKLISDRIPALSNGKIPVEVGSLNVSVSNASLEIANDAGNPIPITGTVSLPTGAATSANQTTTNTSLASIDGKLPASLGAKAASASLAVAPAFAATSTLTNVASSTTSVTLLAANNNRKTVIILNDSTSDLYIVWGASAASTANYSFILAGKGGGTPSSASFTGEDYSGQVTGIWISANGNARITETA